MNIDRDSEEAKWLKLAYETYGGALEMARALRLPASGMMGQSPTARKRGGLPSEGWTTTHGSDTNNTWRAA